MLTFFFSLALIGSMAEGDSAAKAGEWAKAAEYYRLEAEAAPDRFDPSFNYARALAFSGRRSEALAVYSAMLEKSPNNSDVLLGRGRVYTWEKRYAEAESDLKTVTEKSPSYADAWSALGDLYYWSDRFPEAITAYSKWSELRPGDPAPLIARGKVHRAAGDFTTARADFEASAGNGADPEEVDDLVLSLSKRRATPEAGVPEGFHWQASASYGFTQFTPGRAHWNDWTGSLRRYFTRGSLAVEWLQARRFNLDDSAWALDGYLDLWPRSYVNLRYQNGPAKQLYPNIQYYAEIFQGIGRGWELSGSWSHRDDERSNTDMYGAGLGKYVGDFYLRARTTFTPGTGYVSLNNRGTIRYYYDGNADDYVEFAGSWSRGGDLIARTAHNVQKTRSHSLGASFVKYFHRNVGMKMSFSYGDEEGSFVEKGLSTTIYYRW